MRIPQTRSELRSDAIRVRVSEAEWQARVDLAAASELNPMSDAVIAKSTGMYQPGARRRYGPLGRAGLLRRLDRLDPSYKG